eukprot:3644140-Pyramimonas_sp.AAC.1
MPAASGLRMAVSRACTAKHEGYCWNGPATRRVKSAAQKDTYPEVSMQQRFVSRLGPIWGFSGPPLGLLG